MTPARRRRLLWLVGGTLLLLLPTLASLVGEPFAVSLFSRILIYAIAAVSLDALLRIADRHYVMEKGRVVWQGKSAALANDECLKSRYLGV
jgi:hypothetical protein